MRETRESDEFGRLKAEINADARRFDELLFAVTWSLGREAERFHVVPGTRLRRIKTRGAHGLPRLVIYFTIESESLCELQWIEEAIPTDEPPDDIPF